MRSGSWTWRYCSNAARHFSAYAHACMCVCVRMAARVCACARACAAWHLGLGNGAAACEAQVRAQGARAHHVEACRPVKDLVLEVCMKDEWRRLIGYDHFDADGDSANHAAGSGVNPMAEGPPPACRSA